jgi:hypothetical protein
MGAKMNRKDPKKKLAGPWRSLHAAIWLIGIALMISYDWWWPGILIVVAISGVYEAFLHQYAPDAYVEESPAGSSTPPEASTVNHPIDSANISSTPPALSQDHRLELLPSICPYCNGPIRGHEIKWTGPQSANCPYCGSNLPMKTATP